MGNELDLPGARAQQRELIAILAVDILPSELPRESSQHFGDALVHLVEELVEEPIAVEVEMGGIIEVLSPRDQKLMKQIIIAHGLLRNTHTQLLRTHTQQHTPTELPPPTRNMWVGQPCARARA